MSAEKRVLWIVRFTARILFFYKREHQKDENKSKALSTVIKLVQATHLKKILQDEEALIEQSKLE